MAALSSMRMSPRTVERLEPVSSRISASLPLLLLCPFVSNTSLVRQLDRSPTGSAVGARIALAYAQGVVKIGERRRYHSILSLHSSDDAFVGEAVEEVEIEGANGKKGIRVKTSGRGFCASSL